MRLYLSGPMSGHDDWNFPAFREATHHLRRDGFDVVNPAENFGEDPDVPGGWTVYLRRDLAQLCGCNAVAVLPGWERSRGARAEVGVARLLGLPILCAKTCRALHPQPSVELHVGYLGDVNDIPPVVPE